ncbi:FemAB family protein [Leptospira kanakyensis]|uniref:FemAB family protein n=1 Tax=Leptospira kanakyensis TaxID=2484968 RepID=UPI00223CAA43|nr:FemAB family protein [Leptospira kanakyensis]MCW7482135.1 FemAB family protein [Leptospira kanakyensis]
MKKYSSPHYSTLVSMLQAWPHFHSFRSDSISLWDEIYNNSPFQKMDYHSLTIDYQKIYNEAKSSTIFDLSFILKDLGKPVAIWQLAVTNDNGIYHLSTFGTPLQIPLVKTMSDKSIGRLASEWIKLLKEICQLLQIDNLTLLANFRGEENPFINQWIWSLLKNGGTVDLCYDLYVDLKLELETIKSYFRSSYKPLITKGLKIWRSELLTFYDSATWSEFRNLHISVAGRETRSVKTWDIQADSLKNGDGFLVLLRNGDSRLVGAGFFRHSKHEGSYDTAAYDRSLFDMPLGHVVQWLAIEEFKRRGVCWYYIGEYLNHKTAYQYSEKEKNISLFKSGFATNLIPKYKLNLALNR